MKVGRIWKELEEENKYSENVLYKILNKNKLIINK